MFGKIAADALGLSDIGVIVPPSDYNKVDADDYLFHEDGEKIFFLIKSKKDEYCFTNLGMIHVDGDSAVSSKRSIKRYDFSSVPVSHVTIETAGTVDRDVELKFHLGDVDFSIDVRKSFLEPLKDIYKALISISRQQHKDAVGREHASMCLGAVSSAFKLSPTVSDDLMQRQFLNLLGTMNHVVLVSHTTRDYSAVFEKYIRK